jgi:hypothetical protein
MVARGDVRRRREIRVLERKSQADAPEARKKARSSGRNPMDHINPSRRITIIGVNIIFLQTSGALDRIEAFPSP